MALNFKQLFNGLRIKAKAALTGDSKGELEVLESDGKLYYHDGTTRTALITTTSASVITNKDLVDASVNIVDSTDNTKKISFDAAGTTGTKTTLLSSQTTNKTLTLPDATDTLVGKATVDTLTNKTIDANGAGNSISNLETADFAAGILNVSTTLATASDTQVPSALAVKTYVDNKAAAQNEASELTFTPAGTIVATNLQAAVEEVSGDVTDHLSDITDAHDASAISSVASGNLSATDVQSALNELQSDIDTRALASGLSDHLSDTVDAHDASAISSVAAGNLVATDVQSALNELDTEKAKITGDLANAFSVLRSEVASATDTTTTGSNASLAAFTQGIIRVTDGSLVSLANIPAGNSGQQLEIINRTGVQFSIIDSASAIGTAANRIFTGSGATINLAADASLLFEYDSTSARWQIIGGSGGGSATAAVDTAFNINDSVDPTKQINFDAGGTTGTKTTITAAQTANRVLTLPDLTDNLVSRTSTDALTNKTIVVASNTITTAASGNLTATELNTALAELQSDIDNVRVDIDVMNIDRADISVLGDYTQTNLEIITSPVLHGTKSFRLQHSTSIKSFKKVIAVDRKFRGKNNTLTLDVLSTATSGNLNILIYDETNATVLAASQPIATGSQAITAAAISTATLSGMDVATFNLLKVGMLITGANIPVGTMITALNSGALTATMSAASTGTASSIRISDLPAKKSFSFDVPANCLSLSWTISSVVEAYTESYIDDVVIQLTSVALSSTSITVPRAVENSYSAVLDIAGATTNNPTITSTSGTFLTSATYASDRRYNINYSLLNLTLPPAITANVAFDDGTVRMVEPVSVTATTAQFFISAGDGANFKLHFNLDKQGVDYVDPLTATTTTTIPLTTAQLVQQPDSSIRLDTANGYGSTNIYVRRFSNIRDSIGSDVTYSDSATLGSSFTVNSEGLYDISYTDNFTGSTIFGITKNASGATIFASLIATNLSLTSGCTSAAGTQDCASVEAYLLVGDVIRPHSQGSAASDNARTSFTISKQGSLKQLNPSSDSKITIPTHQLRFEGASSRGSTDTAIVKFDTQTITQGDAWDVVNTSANGTVVTMKKAGKLAIHTNIYCPVSTNQMITLNGVTLNSFVRDSSCLTEVVGGSGSLGSQLSAEITVKIGDKIRVVSTANPNALPTNSLNLSLTETSIPANFSNVLPQWSQSDSSVILNTGNGTGSTNTSVRRFSNTTTNMGTSVTYTDSAANGASFTINEDGIYNISYSDQVSGSAGSIAIGLNAITSASASNLAQQDGLSTADNITVTCNPSLVKGDIIRAISTSVVGAAADAKFIISKVGKPNLTSVDVTPFVNMKTTDTQSSTLLQTATFGTANISGVLTSNTNNGIYSYNSTTGVYTALKNASIFVSASIRNTILLTTVNIYKNSTVMSKFSSQNNAQFFATTAANFQVNTGDTFHVANIESNTTDQQFITVLATADNNAVASPTQQVSSDTIPFVFKATAIDPAVDAIGTFNTYTYAASTNTPTIAGTAPTQTMASMNTNGLFLTARASYATLSTAALPARIDIFIGKGLKSKQVDAYISLAKTTATCYDKSQLNSGSDYGVSVLYNEVTGVLVLDAATCWQPSTSNKAIGIDLAGNQINAGYFVFNASKSPSLVTIPNLNQRIAYLSDVKASGTNGGTSVAGIQTRTLNTIVDNTGIITSLVANQFVLPAGTYEFDASAPSRGTDGHKIRLRNITDGATSIVGGSEYMSGASNVATSSRLVGQVTISSSKTFELQHYTTTATANIGLGAPVTSGENEVYAQVKIVKIK